jgi:hypothetical protein
MRRLLVPLFVLLFTLAACGGDDDDNVGANDTTDASTTATTASSTTAVSDTTGGTDGTTACPPLDGATTDETNAPSPGNGLLTNVTLTTGDCTDAVAFTFTSTNGGPGYDIKYEPGPIVQDGSGEPVDVAGSAYLVVRFEPAYGFDFNTGTPTYTGPDHVTSPGAFFVKDVAETGDFEGVVHWAIGLDQQRAYAVDVSGDATKTITVSFR